MSAKKKSRPWTILVVLVAVIAGGIWWTDFGAALGGAKEEALTGIPVKRGPLRISVIERGNLKAADSVDLKSEVEGRTTILYLIEEGTHVEPGDKVCELDASEMVDDRIQQDIVLQNAEANYVNAKQSYEIQKSQNESDIERALRNKEFAKMDLDKYVEGDFPQLERQGIEEITLAEEELKRAGQDLEWSEKLAAKGFLETTQLEADRLKQQRADIQLKQKKRALELLRQYERPRTEKELIADVEEMGRELDRVRLQAEARLVDFEANMNSAKARFDLEVEQLRKLDEQIEKAVIRAPIAGMVVYAVEDRGRWGSGEPMQEGAEVRERQEIITIPSAEGMIAEASLHESVLEKVEQGMPCEVTVDALGESFPGYVKFKAVLPDQNSWWANPDLRVYRTEIAVLETDSRVRPGMSCSVEIVVEDIENALYIPVQSVFLDRGEPVCFLEGDAGVEKQPIEVGQNNGKWVEILGGLEEGQIVYLSQPPGMELEPAVEEDPTPMEIPEGVMPQRGGGGRPGGASADAGGRRGGQGMGGRPGGSTGRGDAGKDGRSRQGGGQGRPAGERGGRGEGAAKRGPAGASGESRRSG